MQYDTKFWADDIFKHEISTELQQTCFHEDAIHRFSLSYGYIDLLCKGFKQCILENVAKPKPHKYVLVCLSGAIGNRESRHPPFFSGVNIQHRLSMPLISISDPTLAMNDDILLSWYAGSEFIKNLPQSIAHIIRKICLSFGLQPIIFGGSGGGWASLAIATYLDIKAKYFVWNPQTNFTEYMPKVVSKYIETAFPAKKNTVKNSQVVNSSLFKGILDSEKVLYDLNEVKFEKNAQIFYIQNVDDWHLERMLVPFMSNKKWHRLGKSSFVDDSGIVVHIGHWGERHAGPPKEMTLEILKLLSNDTNGNPSYAALHLEANYFRLSRYDQPLISASSIDKLQYKANIIDKDSSYLVTVNHPTLYLECDLKFAFYVVINGVKLVERRYSSDNSLEFEKKFAESDTVLIRCFIKEMLSIQSFTIKIQEGLVHE
ncbi:MAG TPA: hypothetical protein DG048_24265 [Pseudoalteromonas sp.]|nr:hypothetical protein [Pseudoalteromonas sp.]|tara:strand:+ start:1717 stop:3003 length:1287 start_codon:yes stop_codon:yes gene_type:complete